MFADVVIATMVIGHRQQDTITVMIISVKIAVKIRQIIIAPVTAINPDSQALSGKSSVFSISFSKQMRPAHAV